jgi:Uncharacterised nucleotidyltransferase
MAKSKTISKHRSFPVKGKKISGKTPAKIRHSRRQRPLKPKLQFEWANAITPEQWDVYREAMQALSAAGIRFMLGGGFAMAAYTGRWRNTKDIDLYIAREDRQAAVDALTNAGFIDYFVHLPYDRNWIYRSTRSGVIVDIIWSMANQRAQVDEHWFSAAPVIQMRGESLAVIPMEEFVWCKLYILQRDHCDWTDVMNVLFAAGTRLDWDHLLWRLEEDWPILKALLTLYGWLCPRRANQLPDSLRKRLSLEKAEIPRRPKRNRIRLLDSRGWFAALLAPNERLEV